MKVILYTLWLITQSPATSQDKVLTCFEILRCQEVKTTCSIILFETGYLQAYKLKVDNAQKHGNILGFYYKKEYIAFHSYADGVRYYQRFQRSHWDSYKQNNPDKTYHDFLVWRGWCDKMERYLKVIKSIESL